MQTAAAQEEKRGKIRIATPEDAPRLLEIYGPYILNTAITMEYEVPSEEEFSGRIRRTLENYPYLVMEEDGQIVGYAYAGRFHPRAAFAWSAEASIYLAPEGKGKGYGRALYTCLEEILTRQNVRNLNACIASPNPDSTHLDDNSLRFHAHMGYQMVGTFTNVGYKFGQWYGLAWMEKMLGDHPAETGDFIPFPFIEKETKEGIRHE